MIIHHTWPERITHDNYRKLQGAVVSKYLERRKKHPSAFPGNRGRSETAIGEVSDTVVSKQQPPPTAPADNATDTHGGDVVATENRVVDMPEKDPEVLNGKQFERLMQQVRDRLREQWNMVHAGMAMEDCTVEKITLSSKAVYDAGSAKLNVTAGAKVQTGGTELFARLDAMQLSFDRPQPEKDEADEVEAEAIDDSDIPDGY